MNQEQFIQALLDKGITLTSKQLEQFENYYQTLVEWNQKMNLTAITQKEDVYLKHFYDSLTISFDYALSNQSLCDVGAGAGFPSIPLKIVYPELKVTIVDSLSKRITFLKHLIQVLDLKDVDAISARAEEYAVKHRESFDIVTARAVARLNILDELCLPLVKVDGDFITLKGAKRLLEIGMPIRLTSDYLLGLIAYNKLRLYKLNSNQTLAKFDLSSSTIDVNDNSRPKHRLS